MNIILIGFMGAGKSAVGHKLTQELGMQPLDTDELIERMEKTSISNIFDQKGEAYFRDLESGVVKTLQDYDNFVISTGGGMVLREENVKILKEVGPLVLLWARPEVVYERIKRQTHRPLLKVADPEAEIKKILDSRSAIYNRVADFEVDTSELSVEEVSKEIINYIKWLRSR